MVMSWKKFAVIACVATLAAGSAGAHEEREENEASRAEAVKMAGKTADDLHRHLRQAGRARHADHGVPAATAEFMRHASRDEITKAGREPLEMHAVNAEQMHNVADTFRKQYREHAIHRPGGTLREGRMAQHSLADGASHNQPLPRNMDHKASAMHKVAKDVAHNFQAMQRGDPRLAGNFGAATTKAMKEAHRTSQKSDRETSEKTAHAKAASESVANAMRDMVSARSHGGGIRRPARNGEE